MFGLLDSFVGGLEDPSKEIIKGIDKYAVLGICITIIIYSLIAIIAWQISKRKKAKGITQSIEIRCFKDAILLVIEFIILASIILVILIGVPFGVFSFLDWFIRL